MVVPPLRFRLAGEPGARWVRCESDGVFLAGVSLLQKASNGFVVRPAHEVSALMLAAYGEGVDGGRTSRGLLAAADALNRGDPALAMIAILHLRLPELDAEAVSRIAAVDDYLAKYDPDEPRDWRGRWTTGGAGGPDAMQTDTASDSAQGSPGAAEAGSGGFSSSTMGHAYPRGRSEAPATPSAQAGTPPESSEVSPNSIDLAAYNGRFHDEVVAEEAARLRSRGETVLTEVKLQMADGSAGARIDILAFDPQTRIVYGIEVKTGYLPSFTPGQIVVYPHLMLGEAVIATDPRVIALGLIPNFPLMPIPIYLMRQRDRYSDREAFDLDPRKMARYYMGKVASLAEPTLTRSW